MSWLSKLFGAGDAPAAPQAEPIEYNGFSITPAPQKDGGKWRIAARIEKDGQVHELIRADTLDSFEAAVDASTFKAKQMIDQMGARVFD